MFRASVIADSLANGVRLLTFKIHVPKFLDAQFGKHRMLSINSSSDRAVPVSRLLELEPYIPEFFYQACPGMQGQTLLTSEETADLREDLMSIYAFTVRTLHRWVPLVHKQHLNRYLLPFSWQNKVITGTEDQFHYFFSLRESADADPNMQKIARLMHQAMDDSQPKALAPGQWHLPFLFVEEYETLTPVQQRRVSVARCARVSYFHHDGRRTKPEEDESLFYKLKNNKHWSCFEHQATPMSDLENPQPGYTHRDRSRRWWSANLRGWVQYRKLVEEGFDD